MILLLPTPILESVIEYLQTDDLVSLSLSNALLNYYCNSKLYRSIILTENNLLQPTSFSFPQQKGTILKRWKLNSFLESLNANKSLVQLIQYVTIITSSSLTHTYSTNDYEPLYQILLSYNSNLRFLENLDYNNVKKCESFLQFNNNYISKRNFKKELLYENDDLTLSTDEYFSKILSLENYQLSSLTDFKLIPDDLHKLTKLSIMMEQVYNERIDIEDLQLSEKLIKNFLYLKILELNSTISSEIFLTKVLNLKSTAVKFHNLETLSMTYVHSIRSQFELILNNEELSRTFCFEKLKNLELKLNCDDVNCQLCFESFVNRLIPNLSNLIRLSLVYITNENLLANSRIDFDHNAGNEQTNYKLAWSNVISNLTKLPKLTYLYLNLNDFTFIPFLKLSNPTISRSINIFNFNITYDYLKTKKRNFDQICSLPLKTLILPDYFYNWKLFDIFFPTQTENDLHFLSYLNKCECDECNESRLLFELYSRSFEFTDNNRLVSALSRRASNSSFKFPVGSNNVSMADIKNYRFFYNSFIRNLKQRLPYTDKIFKNQSGLSILEAPFNQFSLIGAMNEEFEKKLEHYNKFVKLVMHNLRDDLKSFIKLNRRLNRLVLGGIYLIIEKESETRFICNGVYDDFRIVIDI